MLLGDQPEAVGLLARMVALSRLEIKLAVPEQKLEIYHEKAGVFTDADGWCCGVRRVSESDRGWVA